MNSRGNYSESLHEKHTTVVRQWVWASPGPSMLRTLLVGNLRHGKYGGILVVSRSDLF